jgi:hypothetical protein
MRSFTRIRGGARTWRCELTNDILVTPIIPIDNGDDLIEEYSGFGLRFESRNVGTERLGVFFEWSTYDQQWQDVTLAAMALRPDLAPLYRNRMNVTPLVKFAVTPHVTVGGGVAITELDSLVEPGPSRMANAGIGFITFHDQWQTDSGLRQRLEASFRTHAGARSLQSDLVYQRYFMRADYAVGSGRQGRRVRDGRDDRRRCADVRAVLHRRHPHPARVEQVGDHARRRQSLFATTLEYRYRGLMMFFDSGSVWDTGVEQHLRFSTGVGFNRPGVRHPGIPAEYRSVPGGVRDGLSLPRLWDPKTMMRADHAPSPWWHRSRYC